MLIAKLCLTYGHNEFHPHEYSHHRLFCQSSYQHPPRTCCGFLPAARCHHELHLNHDTQFNQIVKGVVTALVLETGRLQFNKLNVFIAFCGTLLRLYIIKNQYVYALCSAVATGGPGGRAALNSCLCPRILVYSKYCFWNIT